jgi:D-alanyl-lipoteichoic acid acyltransferase DltB (MBOAT superfamily)
MLFGSVAFLKFIVLTVAAYWMAPRRHRWLVLLCSSLAFYATFLAPLLLVVLGLVSTVTWYVTCAIQQNPDEKAQRRLLFLSIGFILILLFGVRLLAHFGVWSGRFPGWVRLGSTIGLSYFCLQAIGYLVDTYLGRMSPERKWGHVLLSLAFFPKIAQGPIERGARLLPQLHALETPAYPMLRSALLLFAWGLFKKSVLADRLQTLVDPVFASSEVFSGLASLLAVYAYAFQLYFDFSGYTDMARGCARFFGIELTENFKAPYLATSVSDFWRRWHISFSRWLLDYLFMPLQLSWRRAGVWGTAIALLITFALSGLWHGASSCFMVWGLLHGCYLAIGSLRSRGRKAAQAQPGKARTVLRVVVTFHLVAFAWIFFRADSLANATRVLGSFTHSTQGLHRLLTMGGPRAVYVTLLACVCYGAIERTRGGNLWQVAQRTFVLRWTAYFLLCGAILILGQPASGYIYFQF